MLIDEFFDMIATRNEEVDRLLAKHLTTSPDPISCHTCTQSQPGCCNQKAIISFHEALPIARRLRDEKRDTPELRAKLKELGEAMEGAEREAWFHEAHPCAFLEEGRCSVYKQRPTACRTYFVVTDSALCQPGSVNEIALVNMETYGDQAMEHDRRVHRALQLRETTQRIMMGTLPRLVYIALEAWDMPDFHEFVRRQVWPSEDGLDRAWIDGGNPFGGKLYQIRTAKAAPP